MEAAGDVGRADDAEHVGVVAELVDAEAFAHVAVEIDDRGHGILEGWGASEGALPDTIGSTGCGKGAAGVCLTGRPPAGHDRRHVTRRAGLGCRDIAAWVRSAGHPAPAPPPPPLSSPPPPPPPPPP